MTITEYLEAALQQQDVADDSAEMKELRQHRKDVEALLLAHFGDASPTIRYGGSKAKGTLIKESYDLDIVCYFRNDEKDAGDTLKAIFTNVAAALAEKYAVDPKTSALRLHSKDKAWSDFHIDVVPGRYIDDSKSDCFLYHNGAEKDRLKTNLDTHISTIRDAGVTPALRLLKLWRVRKGLPLKNFVWELLCIELLVEVKTRTLADQLLHVFNAICEAEQAIAIEDPANPGGNDLMEFLGSHWWGLKAAAEQTVGQVESSGWEAVFGAVDSAAKAAPQARLAAAARTVVQPTRPWSTEG